MSLSKSEITGNNGDDLAFEVANDAEFQAAAISNKSALEFAAISEDEKKLFRAELAGLVDMF
jgi:hypothetical protein